MQYKDKIYHKRISAYDEYLIYKNRWNSILNMSERDFDNSFMIITAIENTSMLGLTIENIWIAEDTLYIELDKYPEEVEYNENETCISIIIPKSMDRENIVVRRKDQIEKTPDEKYNWVNTSTEGLTPITKEDAKRIWTDAFKNFNVKYNPINYKEYTEIIDVIEDEVPPNSLFFQEDDKYEVASFKRKVWVVKTKPHDGFLDFLDVYIDMYTGYIIGGYIYGD